MSLLVSINATCHLGYTTFKETSPHRKQSQKRVSELATSFRNVLGNNNQIETNLSLPGIRGCHENALYKSFETSPHLICLYASTKIPLGQPESRPDPVVGSNGILVLTKGHIRRGLVLKLL